MNLSHVLLMKAGPYCGFSLEEIIKIKQQEEKTRGKFFWGYSGVFCRPPGVSLFVTHAHLSKKKPRVLFTKTSSAFQTQVVDRFQKYSVDGQNWKPLPKEVLLVGNKSRPHFAMVCRKLKETGFEINLGDYRVFKGVFPDPNTSLNDYFRFRVDKACANYYPDNQIQGRSVIIHYTCELVEPYCVYIK